MQRPMCIRAVYSSPSAVRHYEAIANYITFIPRKQLSSYWKSSGKTIYLGPLPSKIGRESRFRKKYATAISFLHSYALYMRTFHGSKSWMRSLPLRWNTMNRCIAADLCGSRVNTPLCALTRTPTNYWSWWTCVTWETLLFSAMYGELFSPQNRSGYDPNSLSRFNV